MGHLPQKGPRMFGESYGTVHRDVLDSAELGGLGLTMFAAADYRVDGAAWFPGICRNPFIVG
jgi:hypothetical protein